MKIEQEDILKITNWHNPFYDSVFIRMSKEDYLQLCHERGLAVDHRDYMLVAKTEADIKGRLVNLIKAWYMPEFHNGDGYGRFML